MNVDQRAVIEILTTQVGLALVHDEILGVENAACELTQVESAHPNVGPCCQPVHALGVLVVERLLHQQPHTYPVVGSTLDGLKDRLEPVHVPFGRRSRADVELRDVQGRLGLLIDSSQTASALGTSG